MVRRSPVHASRAYACAYCKGALQGCTLTLTLALALTLTLTLTLNTTATKVGAHTCEEGVHLGEVDPPLSVTVVLAKEGVEDPAQARLVLHGGHEAHGGAECVRKVAPWHAHRRRTGPVPGGVACTAVPNGPTHGRTLSSSVVESP